jgi:hypothetical protein
MIESNTTLVQAHAAHLIGLIGSRLGRLRVVRRMSGLSSIKAKLKILVCYASMFMVYKFE